MHLAHTNKAFLSHKQGKENSKYSLPLPLNPLGPLLTPKFNKRTISSKLDNTIEFLGLEMPERLHLTGISSYPNSESITTCHYRHIGDSVSLLLKNLGNLDSNKVIIIDESELLWDGEDWKNESLLSYTAELEQFAKEKSIFIWIRIDPSQLLGYNKLGIVIFIAPPLDDLLNCNNLIDNTWAHNYIERALGHSLYLPSTWKLVSDLHKDTELQLEDIIEPSVQSLPWIIFKKQRHSLIIKVLQRTGAQYTVINGRIRMSLDMKTDSITAAILKSMTKN